MWANVVKGLVVPAFFSAWSDASNQHAHRDGLSRAHVHVPVLFLAPQAFYSLPVPALDHAHVLGSDRHNTYTVNIRFHIVLTIIFTLFLKVYAKKWSSLRGTKMKGMENTRFVPVIDHVGFLFTFKFRS